MEKIRELLKGLTEIIAPSGMEKTAHSDVISLCQGSFDEAYTDKAGNLVLVKKSKLENAPRIMLDAHLDEIGFIVTEICDRGFLRVSRMGGINTRILPSSEVIICGKKRINGVFTSVPPHIAKMKKNPDSVPGLNELYIDTGYCKEELEKIVKIGDRAVNKGDFLELKNNYVVSKSLDNRASVCALLDMLSYVANDKLKMDVYVVLSAREETGEMSAKCAAYDIKPDYAIIIDVNFASAEYLDSRETISCGKGPSVDFSGATDKELTNKLLELSTICKSPCQLIAEARSTGTNNEKIMLTENGVKTAVMSIPIKFMHSYSEILCLDDIRALSDILLAAVYGGIL
jgi:endoglucanase